MVCLVFAGCNNYIHCTVFLRVLATLQDIRSTLQQLPQKQRALLERLCEMWGVDKGVLFGQASMKGGWTEDQKQPLQVVTGN